MKIIIYVAAGILIFYLLVDYTLDNIASYAIIEPARIHPSKITPSDFGLAYKTIFVRTNDSVLLKAWFVYDPDRTSNVNVIVLHGISDNKASNIFKARILVKNGCNAILPDLRAHGQSQGKYCTFGFYEKKDMSRIIDFMNKELGSNQTWGIWGTSLGGAIALQSLEYDKRLDFGIVESCFGSLRQVVRDYNGNYTGMRINWIADRALLGAESIARFRARDVSPERSASHVDQPVLYIHGARDERINIKYGYRIFRALKSPLKEFYRVDKAGHLDVPRTGGKVYVKRISEFLNKVIKSSKV